MINAELIAKIKAEIKRLKKDNEISEDKHYAQYELDVACGYDMALNDILSFLSTLEVEEPVGEELEKEIVRYCGERDSRPVPDLIEQVARHFAQWGSEHLKR